MSDVVCPKCKNKIKKGDKVCQNCGFSFDNQKIDVDKIKSDFMNFTEDMTSKIQNKLENDDIFKTNEITEMIKNLDKNSLNDLLDKYDISPSRLKVLNIGKLLDNVNIDQLKEDLFELDIFNPKSKEDIETVKVEVTDDTKEEHQNEVPLIENKENFQNNEPKDEKTSNINICSRCGFENRSNVKFCTNCGNKLI